MIPFTHLVLFEDPIRLLAFFSMMMALASLWIRKTPWLWGSFLFISLLSALDAHVVSFISLLPLGLLAALFYSVRQEISGLGRLLLVGSAFLISSGMFFHFLPGFQNWNLACNVILSPGSLPYSLWINYDKAFIGLLILVCLLPTLQGKVEWKQTLRIALPMACASVGILLFLSVYFGIVVWDPKLPSFFFIWLPINLFFVVIPEEALLRGFIQKELFYWLGGRGWAHVGCVLISSLIFALFHVAWVGNVSFLLIVLAAGILYGSIYQYTQRIESSMMCHFAVNVCHLIFFTYPALSKAL